MDDYLEHNRSAWDLRAAAHAASPGYAFAAQQDDPHLLSEVVEHDRPRLGDISGLDVLHLQCHIGTDTLSLHRLGAHVTGVDLSAASLAQARTLAARTGADINFVESDVYAAPEALDGRTFDLVYTGVGALCWLPSIDRWASVVSRVLRPGGRLFVREGHPMLWALETSEHGPALTYPYFERREPMVFHEAGTYVETATEVPAATTHEWNHGIGEIITALLRHGLQITGFEEHDSVPWDALPGWTTVDEHGEYRLSVEPDRLAASYTLQAQRAG